MCVYIHSLLSSVQLGFDIPYTLFFRFADGKLFWMSYHSEFITFLNWLLWMLWQTCFHLVQLIVLKWDKLIDCGLWLIYLCWSVRNWGQCPADTQHQTRRTDCPQQDRLPALSWRMWTCVRSDIHASSGALFLPLRSTRSSPQSSWWSPEIHSRCFSFDCVWLERSYLWSNK